MVANIIYRLYTERKRDLLPLNFCSHTDIVSVFPQYDVIAGDAEAMPEVVEGKGCNFSSKRTQIKIKRNLPTYNSIQNQTCKQINPYTCKGFQTNQSIST